MWQRWQSAFRFRGRLFVGSWSRCAVASLLEGIKLKLGALLLGRNMGIADEHGRILPKLIERVSFRENDFKGAIWEIHRRGIAWPSKPPSQSPEKGRTLLANR